MTPRNLVEFENKWIKGLKNFLENRKLIPACIAPSSLHKLKISIYKIIVLHIILAVNAEKWALAGVAQWIECGPANQGAVGSIPSQGI